MTDILDSENRSLSRVREIFVHYLHAYKYFLIADMFYSNPLEEVGLATSGDPLNPGMPVHSRALMISPQLVVASLLCIPTGQVPDQPPLFICLLLVSHIQILETPL